MSDTPDGHRCGTVALVGRPNVGKSTLLNRLVRQKITITSRRPQPTRYATLGVHTRPDAQIIWVDTPGLEHAPGRGIRRAMNRETERALAEVDRIVFVVEALQWTRADATVLARLEGRSDPPVVAINKVDRVADKSRLLPFLAELGGRLGAHAFIPVSARDGTQLEALEDAIVSVLPAGPRIYDEDTVTDRSLRFLAAEFIREKLMRRLGQEVPYCIAVGIDAFEESPTLVRIAATIWVERDGQKAMVVGRGGSMLRAVGEEARLDLERLIGVQVFLETWVKVREGWTEDAHALRELGFDH